MVLQKQLVRNLLNPDHELVKNIKDITVIGFGRFKEPWSLGVSELEKIIGRVLECYLTFHFSFCSWSREP